MKNIILIEAAPNGWVVRSRHPCRNVVDTVLAVFNHIEDLQKQLPVLLECPDRELVNFPPATAAVSDSDNIPF